MVWNIKLILNLINELFIFKLFILLIICFN